MLGRPLLASTPPQPEQRPGGAFLAAVALAAAGLGFATYLYVIPFRRAADQLKRRESELRAAQTEAETRRKELARLRHDMFDVQGASSASLTTEGRLRSEMRLLKAEIDQRLGPLGVEVTLEPRRMLIRFPEDAAFDARGPWLGKPGQEAVQALAQLIGDRGRRVVVAAPMGGASVPRWVRDKLQLATVGDLSAARAGNTLRVLVKGGLRVETVLAVVGSLATDEPTAPATLDIELEP